MPKHWTPLLAIALPCSLSSFGAEAEPAAPPRPLSGHCDTVYEIGAFDGTSLQVTHHGTCRLTHLGVGSLFKDELVGITIEPAPIHGRLVITAANGDKLYGTETASVFPPDIDNCTEDSEPGRWDFSGGTGRFANASGSATWHASINPCTLTTSRNMKGTLSYGPRELGPLDFRVPPHH